MVDEYMGTRGRSKRFSSRALGHACYHADRSSTPDSCLLQTNIGEAVFAASIRKGGGLLVGPAMAPVPSGTWFYSPLDGDQTASGEQHPVNFSKPAFDVRPMVHGRNGPYDRNRTL